MCLAIPGRIVHRWQDGAAVYAIADFAAEQSKICLDFLPDVNEGDYVVAHAGFALTKIAPEVAVDVFGAADFPPIETLLSEIPDTPPLPGEPVLEEPVRQEPPVDQETTETGTVSLAEPPNATIQENQAKGTVPTTAETPISAADGHGDGSNGLVMHDSSSQSEGPFEPSPELGEPLTEKLTLTETGTVRLAEPPNATIQENQAKGTVPTTAETPISAADGHGDDSNGLVMHDSSSQSEGPFEPSPEREESIGAETPAQSSNEPLDETQTWVTGRIWSIDPTGVANAADDADDGAVTGEGFVIVSGPGPVAQTPPPEEPEDEEPPAPEPKLPEPESPAPEPEADTPAEEPGEPAKEEPPPPTPPQKSGGDKGTHSPVGAWADALRTAGIGSRGMVAVPAGRADEAIGVLRAAGAPDAIATDTVTPPINWVVIVHKNKRPKTDHIPDQRRGDAQ